MASHHKKTVYTGLPVENPFGRQEKIYGDLLAEERKGKNRWRVTAFISQAFVLLNGSTAGEGQRRAKP
jgi:hypothetical protein